MTYPIDPDTFILCRITRREAEHLGMSPAVAGGWVGVSDDLRHAADAAATKHRWPHHGQLGWHIALLRRSHSHARRPILEAELATILARYAGAESAARDPHKAVHIWTDAIQARAAELRELRAPSADEAAILLARCPSDHSGPHYYDVAATAQGRIAGMCRGCGSSISAHEAHEQPHVEGARDRAIRDEERRKRDALVGII